MDQKRARQPSVADYIKALPKVELHLHLEGSLRPQRLLTLAERNRLRLPFAKPEEFDQLYRYGSFKDFANALLLGVACLRKPEDFYEVVHDLGDMLAADNIRYAEVTWTPQLYLNRGYPLDALLAAMNAARHEIRQHSGIEIRWIPDLVRSYPQHAQAIAAWLSSPAIRDAGVVALGLGGPEAGHPATVFRPAFALARKAGLPANPHAGEGAGPDSMWETIEQLQPVRIGHGVRSIEDPSLVDYLATHKIPLEVNITSNIRLGVFPSYASHPVKDLIRAGCTVVLNTDDPVLFGTTLSDEYMHGIVQCGLDLNDIRQSILAGVQSSYLPDEQKLALLRTFDTELKRLDAVFPGLAAPLAAQ